MEKEPQPDSLTDVTVKQYAPSEVYSSEPPPAYHKPQSTAVQVARIAAVTVVAVSVVLGGFILAAAYVQANASCQQLETELQLLQEEQRLQQSYQPLQPEALVQEEPIDRHNHIDSQSSHTQSNKNDKNNDDSNDISQESSESDDSSSEDDDRTPIHIKLPLQLDFDDLAGMIMEKNQRSRMNCIVEKKKAEEVIDHQPKTVRLPFGLNLTTDPRYEHVTGERMVIVCESGDEQRHMPQQQEETMMVQPIIVPLGNAMNIPFPFNNMQPQQHPQMRPQHSMGPHPGMLPQNMEAIRAHTIIMEQIPQRPPVPAQHTVPPQPNQIPEQIHPNPLVAHIAQQIIAQHQQEMAAAASRQAVNQPPQMMHQQVPHPKMPMPDSLRHQLPEGMMAHRLPIPEEILTQINRLPNQDVIVSVSEHEAEEVPQDDIRIVQHQRESAQEMNGRQNFARGLPVHIPVPMMQQIQQIQAQVQHEQQLEQQQQQTRPHYVQPRSVRSVDSVLHREKRVKRCACDCAC